MQRVSAPVEGRRLGRDDLPVLTKVAEMAYLWIFQQRAESQEESTAAA
jgi:hypothetical protein